MSHPDLDALLNVLLPFAQEMLAKRGEFLPFGASMSQDGEIAMAAASLSDPQTPEQLLRTLEDGLRTRASASEIRAAGVCADVRIRHPDTDQVSDAIQARLEHAEGEAVDVLLPYRKKLFGRLTYGEPFAEPGSGTIFRR
jgi:hypothetical protein